ncbi:hypothetical protein GTW43_35970 [Streptomyces sp. SID5785]|uniref:hypothetical protein n=1 Tax=Streptomyces sp. SID5785 TaxID=2690309 RepID=UPI001360E0B0|nr:hypothetical protein [Streptomyces sp. SID5785]MZD10436.1 hypothetical protein [Streptomyces sp. SID5785]
MNDGTQCWSCGDPAHDSAALRVRMRREGGGVYWKAGVRVPLCAGCRSAWRPALRARRTALWALTLGAVLAVSTLVVDLLTDPALGSGTMGLIAAAIAAVAAAVGVPAYRAQARHPEGLRHPHTHPDVVALTGRGFGILN